MKFNSSPQQRIRLCQFQLPICRWFQAYGRLFVKVSCFARRRHSELASERENWGPRGIVCALWRARAARGVYMTSLLLWDMPLINYSTIRHCVSLLWQQQRLCTSIIQNQPKRMVDEKLALCVCESLCLLWCQKSTNLLPNTERGQCLLHCHFEKWLELKFSFGGCYPIHVSWTVFNILKSPYEACQKLPIESDHEFIDQSTNGEYFIYYS